MTDMSSSGSLTGIARVIARPISVTGLTPGAAILNARPLSEQQQKDIAERDKITLELSTIAEKAMRESEASRKIESNETYLPNISTLTLETAKTVLGQIDVAKQMNLIQGTNIHGNNHDQVTSSLDTYISWVKQHISSFGDTDQQTAATVPSSSTPVKDAASQPVAPGLEEPASAPGQEHIILPNVSSLSSATAASVYKQVNNIIDTNQIEGRVLVTRNGESSTRSIDTYLSWLSVKAGIDRAV